MLSGWRDQMLRLATLALGLCLMIVPVAAQTQASCPARDAILQLSDVVIGKRGALKRLEARNFGIEAAFLKIRYGELPPAEVEALLASPQLEDARGLADLVFAWSVHNLGLAATAERIGPQAMEASILASPSSIRALVLREAEDVVVNAFAALEGAQSGAVAAIYTAIIDLDDARKARVVAEAVEKDQWLLAVAVAATMRDQEAWPTALGNIADSEEAIQLSRSFRFLPRLVGNPDLPLAPGEESFDPVGRKRLNDIIGIAAMQPQLDFLSTYVNYSGLVDETTAASAALLSALDTGTVARKGPLDAGWLVTYRALVEASADDAALDETLRNITPRARAFRTSIAETLDWIIAVDALRAYVRGESDEYPDAPPHGPGGTLGADWNTWTRIAEFIVSGTSLVVIAGNNERELAMAAELLLVRDDPISVAWVLDNAAPTATVLNLATDFADRMDRQCEGYTWHMAESLLLAGQPIYKFDNARLAPMPPGDEEPDDPSLPEQKGAAKTLSRALACCF
jgi:hypothetical protein